MYFFLVAILVFLEMGDNSAERIDSETTSKITAHM